MNPSILPSAELRKSLEDLGARAHFSQFGEDVILWSLLQTFNMLEKRGFYVDVGALHPNFISNTKMLNLMGWRGVNIDANEDNIEIFKRERPNDINIVAAISDVVSDIQFNIYDVAALSTADPSMIAKHAKVGTSKVIKSIKMQTVPLAQILKRTVPVGQVVDVMSIDVEGFDLKALQSNDWSRFAPLFLMIEDHELSLIEKPDTKIFHFLKAKGYRLVAVTFVTSIYVRDQV